MKNTQRTTLQRLCFLAKQLEKSKHYALNAIQPGLIVNETKFVTFGTNHFTRKEEQVHSTRLSGRGGKMSRIVLGRCRNILCKCGYLDEMPLRPQDSTMGCKYTRKKEDEEECASPWQTYRLYATWMVQGSVR